MLQMIRKSMLRIDFVEDSVSRRGICAARSVIPKSRPASASPGRAAPRNRARASQQQALGPRCAVPPYRSGIRRCSGVVSVDVCRGSRRGPLGGAKRNTTPMNTASRSGEERTPWSSASPWPSVRGSSPGDRGSRRAPARRREAQHHADEHRYPAGVEGSPGSRGAERSSRIHPGGLPGPGVVGRRPCRAASKISVRMDRSIDPCIPLCCAVLRGEDLGAGIFRDRRHRCVRSR